MMVMLMVMVMAMRIVMVMWLIFEAQADQDTDRIKRVMRVCAIICKWTFSKMLFACGNFHIFTSKCASGHNGVHLFDISTSKSRPSMVCFVHFYFQMCFAPQRCALFPHLNSKSPPTPACRVSSWLCTFHLSILSEV